MGGVIQIARGQIYSNNCIYSQNYAKFRGGVFYITHGNIFDKFKMDQIVLNNSQFNDNYAVYEGGVLLSFVQIIIQTVNCTFNGNSAGLSYVECILYFI